VQRRNPRTLFMAGRCCHAAQTNLPPTATRRGAKRRRQSCEIASGAAAALEVFPQRVPKGQMHFRVIPVFRSQCLCIVCDLCGLKSNFAPSCLCCSKPAPADGNFKPSKRASKFPLLQLSFVSSQPQIRQSNAVFPGRKQIRFHFRFPKFPVSKPYTQKWKLRRSTFGAVPVFCLTQRLHPLSLRISQ